MTNKLKAKYGELSVSLFISLAAAGVGALVSSNSREVLSALNQPSFSPPAWLFPIVWTILFILMGISSFLVRDSDAPAADKRSAMKVYGWQLVLNILWSAVFFRLELFYAAFVWLCVLWALIGIMIFLFRRCDTVAALLQLPYLLWVTFAGVLNLSIAILN